MRSPTPVWSSHAKASSSSPTTRYARANMNDVKSGSNTGAQEVFQTIYNGRKSWKTLRGGRDGLACRARGRFNRRYSAALTPPVAVVLTLCLRLGLEQYQPDDSRETRLLGRFPMRNRFISEYIFRKTGRRRTAKQVGSRLQQLRGDLHGEAPYVYQSLHANLQLITLLLKSWISCLRVVAQSLPH